MTDIVVPHDRVVGVTVVEPWHHATSPLGPHGLLFIEISNRDRHTAENTAGREIDQPAIGHQQFEG